MNQLYYGDNLPILREHVESESVDLVYLDPPFNSNADYNVLFAEKEGIQSAAQIRAFEDTWNWNPEAEQAYMEVVEQGGRVSLGMQAFRQFLGTSDMMAYLAMMAPRLIELRRVLKPHGSIYLHCDPTASHYLKLLLDSIFGPVNYRNEIVWKRTSARSDSHTVNHIHDIIFLYTKTEHWAWNVQYTPYDTDYIDQFYKNVDEAGRRFMSDNLTAAGIRHGTSGMPWRGVDPTQKGRHWIIPGMARALLPDPEEADSIKALEELDKLGCILWPKKEGGVPRFARYLDKMPGMPLQSIWSDIPPLSAHAAERLGYPTQKPEALLDRIIQSSSNAGDIVLDPFCGCGTAVASAQKLGRKWLGIDITHLAITLIRNRMIDSFGVSITKKFQVIGEPTDLEGARMLAADPDRYQFQWWALGLVGARPVPGEQKKGADKGIDGRLFFFDDPQSGQAKQIIFSVKSGHLKASEVRDLRGVIDREQPAIGVLISLDEPTKAMLAEAASAGHYVSPFGGKKYPRMQLKTVEDLLAGKGIEMPPHERVAPIGKRAPKVKKPKAPEGDIFQGEAD